MILAGMFARQQAAVGGGGGGKVYTLRGNTGLTALQSTYSDDASLPLPGGAFAFTIRIFGTDYGPTGVNWSANSFLSFGSSVVQWSGFSPSSPGVRNLKIAAADRSVEKIYGGAVAGGYVIRYEGSATRTSGDSTSHVWETTLYDDGTIVVVTGVGFDSGGTSGMSNGTANSGTFAPVADSGYLFTPDSNGDNWVITKER